MSKCATQTDTAATTTSPSTSPVALMLHPDILGQVVSYFSDEKHHLFNVMQVSKAFFFVASPLLYRTIYMRNSPRRCPIRGYIGPTSSACSKFRLMGSTTRLAVRNHSHSVCTSSPWVDAEQEFSAPVYMSAPFNRLRSLSIRPYCWFDPGERECLGLDCPMTKDLKPTSLTLYPQSWWRWVGDHDETIFEIEKLPAALLSNVRALRIYHENGGLQFFPTVFQFLSENPFPKLQTLKIVFAFPAQETGDEGEDAREAFARGGRKVAELLSGRKLKISVRADRYYPDDDDAEDHWGYNECEEEDIWFTEFERLQTIFSEAQTTVPERMRIKLETQVERDFAPCKHCNGMMVVSAQGTFRMLTLSQRDEDGEFYCDRYIICTECHQGYEQMRLRQVECFYSSAVTLQGLVHAPACSREENEASMV